VRGPTSGGQVELEIGGQRLAARTNLPLPTGQELQLRVARGGERPLLQLVQGGQMQEPLNQAARAALPRQQPLAPLLDHLQRLLPVPGRQGPAPHTPTPPLPTTRGEQTAQAGAAIPLSRPVTSLLKEILHRLPSPHSLARVDGLRQAVQESGLLLESHLARRERVSGDLQGQLLRLARLLRSELAATPRPESGRGGERPSGERPVFPEGGGAALLREVEGAVARIKLNQLHTFTPQSREQATEWVIELPLRHQESVETLRLRIRREPPAEGAAAPEVAWSVNLDLADATHGPIGAVVTLQGERISATFWAERAATAALFRTHLPLLQERLDKAGLTVARLDSLQGTPPSTDAAPLQKLLDVRA